MDEEKKWRSLGEGMQYWGRPDATPPPKKRPPTPLEEAALAELLTRDRLEERLEFLEAKLDDVGADVPRKDLNGAEDPATKKVLDVLSQIWETKDGLQSTVEYLSILARRIVGDDGNTQIL